MHRNCKNHILLMKLIVMTKPTFFVEENKIIEGLFELGLDELHLYKPNSSPMYSERLLTLLPDCCYSHVVVHDHYYLKEEYKLHGIHIDDANAQPPTGYRGHISRSCTDLALLKEMKSKAEYVFLKHIFDSQTFKDERATFTGDQLKAAQKQGLIDRHVYALGGINIGNIQMAKELGFGGVVISGDLWNRFNIHQGMDYKDLLAHFEKLRKAVK